MDSIPRYIAAFLALLACIFLGLSATRGTPPARKTWRRIGIIFAAVALLLLAVRSRVI
jgi:type IV secretory pathway VirB2 component (pilin)